MERLEGKAIAQKLSGRVEESVRKLKAQTGVDPKLVTLFIGNDTASEWYNKSIKKACEKVGIGYELFEYSSIELNWVKDFIGKLNEDPSVHGILINQPLPDNFKSVVELIHPGKDIEGVTAQNLGRLMLNDVCHVPCTPLAVMTILDDYKIDLSGLNVCVIGRSNIVGKPLGQLLTHRNATVTLCHSKTRNLPEIARNSDMVIAAIGVPRFVKSDWVKEGAIVIDVGTNYTDSGLVGDVDYETVKERASKITPVPGGVGGLTNIILLKNCIEAFMRQYKIDSI